jgi:hypothetical protein
MSEVALRDNAGKPELSYILDLRHALEALAAVFSQGAIKYERGNWKKGGKPDEEYLDSALRHIFKARTEDYDEETGCLHAAHAVWNLMALIELNYTRLRALDPDFDQAAFLARYAK